MTAKDVEEVMADLKNKKCEGFNRISLCMMLLKFNNPPWQPFLTKFIFLDLD